MEYISSFVIVYIELGKWCASLIVSVDYDKVNISCHLCDPF